MNIIKNNFLSGSHKTNICPYCGENFDNLFVHLAKHQVKIIFTPKNQLISTHKERNALNSGCQEVVKVHEKPRKEMMQSQPNRLILSNQVHQKTKNKQNINYYDRT